MQTFRVVGSQEFEVVDHQQEFGPGPDPLIQKLENNDTLVRAANNYTFARKSDPLVFERLKGV